MRYKNLVLMIVTLGLFLSKIAFAFDPATDCSIKITKANFLSWKLPFPKGVQNILDDYANSKYSNLVGSEYILCFDFKTADKFEPKSALNIDTSKIQKPLIIYNLIADAAQLLDPTLLTLTGSNPSTPLGAGITLDHVTLTGPGSGTAIQVNGKNIAIQSSTISNFDIGIQIGTETTAGENIAILSSTINSVETAVNLLNNAGGITIDKLAYSTIAGGKALEPAKLFDLVGKKCATTIKNIKGVEICDASAQENKVTEIDGEIPSTIAGDCNGTPSLFKRNKQTNIFEHLMDCLAEKAAEKIEIVVDKLGNLQTIQANSCIFGCDTSQKELIIKDNVALIYNSASENNIFSVLFEDETDPAKTVPAKKIEDLPDVISTGAMPATIPTSLESSMSGSAEQSSGAVVYVPGLSPTDMNATNQAVVTTTDSNDATAAIDADDKTENDDDLSGAETVSAGASGSSDGDKQVGQGSGAAACGANLSVSAAAAQTIWLQIILLTIPAFVFLLAKKKFSV